MNSYKSIILYHYEGQKIVYKLTRNGDNTASLNMDEMRYFYPTSGEWQSMKENNQLNSVMDDTPDNTGDYPNAFKQGQSQNNYTYYANGQLKSDKQENIDLIEWTVRGKVKRINSVVQDIPTPNPEIKKIGN